VGHEGKRNLGPTKAAADLKLARDGAAAAKRKLAGFRAEAEQLAACLVGAFCLGPTKAAVDWKLAHDAMAAAKRKLAGFRAEAEQ